MLYETIVAVKTTVQVSDTTVMPQRTIDGSIMIKTFVLKIIQTATLF